MRFRVSVAGLLACWTIFACAQDHTPGKTVDRPIQNQSFAQEDAGSRASLSALETELRAQVAQTPSSADVAYKLAAVLREEHKFRESLDMYTRAAGLQKPTAMQLRSVALNYVQLNDYDDAIHWLRIALGMDPANPDILYSLGRCFYTRNNFPQAEAAFTRILQLQPRHLKAEENLGLTYDAENKPQQAEQALRTAATWAEQDGVQDEWPYLDLGSFLLDHSRPAEALPILQKGATIAPQSPSALQKLGRALIGTGSPADAVKALEKAAVLDPNNPKIHLELGRAYRMSGQAEKAQAEFDLSKRLYGNHNQD